VTEILTRKEVGEFLTMPIRTIDYWVTTGQIPFSRLGKRSVRFNRARLQEWIVERENIEYRYKK